MKQKHESMNSVEFLKVIVYSGGMSRFQRILCAFFLLTTLSYAFPKPTVTTFDNGVTLVMVNDPSATVASSYVFVRTGSLFEGPWMGAGLSHYLEHLVAGGTTSRQPESNYRRMIDALGGISNAYTTYDHTAYFIKSSSENTPKALQILYEWMAFSDWTNDEYVREKGVVKKEMERAKSNVERSIYQKLQSLFYKDSPYRVPIIGYEDAMLNTSSEDLKAYYKLTYVPENMVVVVGGNISEDEIVTIVENSFGQLPKKAAPIRSHGSERRILSSSHSSIILDKLTTQRVVIRYPIVSFYHDDVYPLDLLAYIFGNGQQSLLYQEFVVNRSLATSISVHSITPSYDIGYFEIALETTQNNETVIREVQDFIDQFRWRRIELKRIQKAVSQKRTEYVLGQNSLDGYLKDIGQSMMMGQNPLFFQQYSTGFSNVTPGDLTRVVAQYLSKNKRQSYVFRQMPEVPLSTKAIKITPPILEPIRAGVDALKITESNDDIVRVTCHFNGGIDEEGALDNGIGHLTAGLLGKKILGMDRDAFQERFESKGAIIGARLSHNAFTYGITLTTKDVPKLLPLFIKGITQFDVDEATFTEVKSQQLKSIQKRSEDWFQDAFDQLKKNMNARGGVFSKSLKGTQKTLDPLTIKDVQKYLLKRLNHSPLTIVVQSSNPDAIVDILKKELSILGDRSTSRPALPSFKSDTSYSLNLSQPVGVVMRVDPLVQPISTLDQYLKMQLVDALLSGMRYPSGVLHERLRGNQLVYVVHTVHMRWGEKDMLFTYALTDSKNVPKVSTMINDAFEEMKETITNEQFELAKAQVLFNFQNSRQEQTMKGNDMLYHYQTFSSIANDTDIQQALTKISINDVQAFIKKIMTKSYIFKFNG